MGKYFRKWNWEIRVAGDAGDARETERAVGRANDSFILEVMNFPLNSPEFQALLLMGYGPHWVRHVDDRRGYRRHRFCHPTCTHTEYIDLKHNHKISVAVTACASESHSFQAFKRTEWIANILNGNFWMEM